MSKNASPFERSASKWSVVLEQFDSNGDDMLSQDRLYWACVGVNASFSGNFWFILHDCDLLPNGQVKPPHFHVLFAFPNRVYGHKLAGEFSDRLGWDLYSLKGPVGDSGLCYNPRIGLRTVSSLTAALRYLVHLDDGDKMSYMPSDVMTSDRHTFGLALEDISKDFVSFDSLYRICENCGDQVSVMREIGVLNYNRFRNVISLIMDDVTRKRIARLSEKGGSKNG